MKNAALILGIIGGSLGLITGLSVLVLRLAEGWVGGASGGTGAGLTVLVLVAPVLAIVGGAMAVLRPYLGSGLMLLAAAGLVWGQGVSLITLLPVALCLLGGLLGMASSFVADPERG